MYSEYYYNPGATSANVLLDIIAILTGETNVNNLSASCNKASSTITSTIPAGWSVHDSAASATSQVVKSLNSTGSNYKYFRINFSNTTTITGSTYSDWNSTTHTGTHEIATNSANWDSAAGGIFYIYASQYSIFIQPYVTGSGFKSIAGLAIFELNASPALVTTGTYSKHLFLNSNQMNSSTPNTYGGIPKIKWPGGVGDVAPASVYVGPINTSPATYNSHALGTPFYRDVNDNVYVQLCKIGASYGAIYLGETYDVFTCGKVSLNNLDEVVYSGNNHIIFILPYATIVVRKG